MSQSKSTIMLTDKNPAEWERAIREDLVQKIPITAKPLQDGMHPNPDVDRDYSLRRDVLDPTGEMADVQYSMLCNQSVRNTRDYTVARQQATSTVTATVSDIVKFQAQNNQEYATLVRTFDYIGLIQFLYVFALGTSASRMHYEAVKAVINAEMRRDEPSAVYFQRMYTLHRRIQAYSRAEPHVSLEETLAHAFVRGLGPQFKTFTEDTLQRFGQAIPLTIDFVIEQARQWEKAATSQPKSLPAHMAMLGEQPRCRICGADHDKSECTVENPSCSICKAEGRDIRIVKGHTTHAHIGPRKQQTKAKPKPKARALVATDHAEESSDSHDDADEYIGLASETSWNARPAQRTASKLSPPEQILSHQYEVVPVQRDGHCMYRCAMAANNGSDHMALRERCADMMDQCPDFKLDYGCTLRQEIGSLNPGRSFEEVVDAVRRSQYGGDLELRILETAIGVGFAVYKARNDGTLTLLRAPPPGTQDECHSLLFTEGRTEAGNHYDWIRIKACVPLAPIDNRARTFADVVRGVRAPSHPRATPPVVVSAPTQTALPAAPLAQANPPAVVGNSESPDESPKPIAQVAAAIALTATKVQTSRGKRRKQSNATKARKTPDVHIHLDSGATTHLLHPSVPLVGKEEAQTRIQGVGGSITATTIGVHRTLGRAIVYDSNKGEDKRRSLISLSKLAKSHQLRYNPDSNTFVAKKDGVTMTFREKDGLYTLSNPESVFTLIEDMPKPTPARFQAIASLHRRLNHPSDAVLARTVASGAVAGCVTDDVRRAREHFGPCMACLAGKNTQDASKPTGSPPPPFASSLHVDIAFVHDGGGRKSPYLIGVEESTGMAMAVELEDRTAPSIGKALNRMIDQCDLLSRAKIREVRVDPEQGFVSAQDALAARGIRLVIVPAERHVRLAERVIRELKNYMRATIAGLPFKLPLTLYPYLLMDVVRTRNLISHNGNPKSPRQLLTRTSPQLDRDIKFAFGTIGHCRVSGLATKDDMHPRTELAIIAGHYLDEAGAVMVWLPRSGRIVKRNSFFPVAPTADLLRELSNVSDVGEQVEPLISELYGGGDHSDNDELNAIHLNNSSETTEPSPDEPTETTDASPDETTTTQTVTTTPGQPEPLIAFDYPAPSTVTQAPISDAPGSTTTRSGRTSKPPNRLIHSHMLLADNEAQKISAAVTGAKSDGNFTIRQALAMDNKKALKAIRAELDQMLKLKVIGRKSAMLGERPLPLKMFLKWKTIQGTLEFKARLVIGGHMQDKVSMGETYSPTVNPESTNLVLVIAARAHKKPYTVDVSGAFLHVPLKGTTLHMRLSKEIASLLVEMDPGFASDVAQDGTIIVRIQKAIYGLGESSRQWHDHLAATLSKLGYLRAQYDRCIFLRRHDSGRLASILAIHVDDILAVDIESPSQKEQLIRGLTEAYGKVTVNDDKTLVYLGVTINCHMGLFTLHQRELIQAVDYPVPGKTPRNAASSDILKPVAAPPATDSARFRSTLMRLLYIATKTRFDLLFAVNVLASRQQFCTQADERALSQLVGFLKATAHWEYRIAPTHDLLLGWADASYACHADGRGHSGVVCSVGGAPVFVRSAKQKITSKSSTEAELIALNYAADEVVYLRNLLEEVGMQQKEPTEIKQDNNSAIIMAERGELGTKRTKHFTVRHYFVTQLLADGTIRITHQPGGQMLADGLTKPLTGPFGRAWAQRLLAMADRVNHADDCEVQGTLLEKPTNKVVSTRHGQTGVLVTSPVVQRKRPSPL